MARCSNPVAVAVFVALAGCSSVPDRPVITVPVSVIPKPPVELLTPIERPPTLTFVSPTDPKATSALTPDGEAALRKMIGQMLDRLDAWRAWSNTTSE